MYRVAQDFAERAAVADFVAVIDDRGEHGARELLAQADALAAVLAPLGRSGTVLVQADNSWRTVAAALAVARTEGTLAVVNRHTTAAEFAAAVEDLRPDAVVTDRSAAEEWGIADLSAWPGSESGSGQGRPRQAEVLDGWQASAGPAGADPDHRLDNSRWRGGALIGLTSGSTGRAKGVVLAESALRYAGEAEIKFNGLQEGDAIAVIVPLSSAAAQTFGLHLSLLLRGPLVLWDRWDPARTLARMAQERVRWTMCVPTMALRLGAEAAGSQVLAGMRSMTVGGGPMDVGALGRAEQSLGTKIMRVFGMSEVPGHTSPRLDDPPEIRLGRDGRPFPGTRIRAVDQAGRELPVGVVGAAQVKGPSMFLGYAREGRLDPPVLTADGYLATGDLVMTYPDGTIQVMGREKDIIIRGGRNIDITEVEKAVAAHPRVAQVCVVPVPDADLGERIAALLVLEDDRPMTLDVLVEHLGAVGLSKSKWPEFVFAVPELPQSTVGKIARPAAAILAQQLREGAEALA